MNPKPLTVKQEKFAQQYALHGVGARAYRESYDVEKLSDEACSQEANRLMQNPQISRKVEELRAAAAERAGLTFDAHMEMLAMLRDCATASGKYTAAIQAEMARGKCAGLYVDRVQHSGNVTVAATVATELSDDQLAAIAADAAHKS